MIDFHAKVLSTKQTEDDSDGEELGCVELLDELNNTIVIKDIALDAVREFIVGKVVRVQVDATDYATIAEAEGWDENE